MKIVAYYNNSEHNVLNKAIIKATEYVGFLRDSSDIVNPTFTIEQEYVPNFNYVYIENFSRYYYVSNIHSIATGLWEISCTVDVLMSFKNSILKQTAIIARQENEYNLYLDDNRLLTTCRRQYYTKAFPQRVFPAEEGSSFILTVAGGQETSSQ